MDGNPAAELNDKLARIIGMCDVILTPIVDPNWKEWAGASDIDPVNADKLGTDGDIFSKYGAKAWGEYSGRAWCRLESFFAANCPLVAPPEDRAGLLGGPPSEALLSAQRTHLIFGSREAELGLLPVVLPRLADEMFSRYDPRKGQLTSSGDMEKIEGYVVELCRINGKFVKSPAESTERKDKGGSAETDARASLAAARDGIADCCRCRVAASARFAPAATDATDEWPACCAADHARTDRARNAR